MGRRSINLSTPIPRNHLENQSLRYQSHYERVGASPVAQTASMADMEKSSLMPEPPTPTSKMAQDQSPPSPGPQATGPQPAITVVFFPQNAVYANGATTTAEGYVTYPDLPHVFGGGLRNGLPSGTGVLKNSSTGNTYEGGWKDGRAHGYGVFYWSNGDRYEGGWKAGMQHGYGEVTGTIAGVQTRIEVFFRDGFKAS
jgi:hypothetical protein